MLTPRRTKWRRQYRAYHTGNASGGAELAFGNCGTQTLTGAYVTNRQIEVVRIAMTRHIKHGGEVWTSIFSDRPLTKKPTETRMGSGKDAAGQWVTLVKPDRILFGLGDVDESLIREAMHRTQRELPMKTRFVVREGGDI